jgi:hypothetical protein
MAFKFPEKYRLRKGAFGSSLEEHGLNGAGFIPNHLDRKSGPLKFIASDGRDMPGEWKWEHVSVSLPARCPTWAEMCFIKSLFWDDEDAVMELHPPRSTWVSNHEFCLHLWRPVGREIPLPPEFMVGIKEWGTLPLPK